MKICIDGADLRKFADAVAVVAKNLPGRPANPILAGIMLRARDGQLTLSGYNYEVSTAISVPTTGGEDGSTLVSGQLLANIVKLLRTKSVLITAADGHLELICGSARFTLPVMPVEDYPTLPAMPNAIGTVDASTFTEGVSQVAFAASRNPALPAMNGVLVEPSHDRLRMTATDRYRVAVRDIPWQPSGPGNVTPLVPARVLEAASKALGATGTVTVATTESIPGTGLIGFAAGGSQMTSNLLDVGTYPPAHKTFPTSHCAEACVEVAALSFVVAQVSQVIDPEAKPVVLHFDSNGLYVEAGEGNASAHDSLDLTFTGDAPMAIGFKAQYLLEGLAALGTKYAQIELVSPIKPVVIRGVDKPGGAVNHSYRYLTMPLRVLR